MKQTERFTSIQTTVFWIMLICVLGAAIPLGANRPVSWTLFSMIVTVLFVVQICLDGANRMPAQTKGLWLPVVLFLGALAWGAIQILPGVPARFVHPVWEAAPDVGGRISADPGQGSQVLMRYLCYAMIFWIAFRSAISADRAGAILKTFALFSTALAIFGFYTLAIGQNPVTGKEEAVKVITATFVNRNSYATYAAFGVLANIAAYLHVTSSANLNEDHWRSHLRDMLERFFSGAWIYALGTLLCLGALSLTQSRAGGVACLVGLLVFVASWRGKGRQWNPLLLLVVAAVVGFVILTSATGMTNRILATGAENGRFLIYPEVVNAIMDRPLLGHGLGSFHDVFRQYVPAEAAVGEWVRAHNSFLENAFEFGLPAAGAFYLCLLLITLHIRAGTIKRSRNRAYSCFALGCIAIAATHSLFDFSLQMPAIAAVFAVILALGWSQSFSRRGQKRSMRHQSDTGFENSAQTHGNSNKTLPPILIEDAEGAK